MIYDQLVGVITDGGRIQLLCGECKAPAQDCKSLTIQKVCVRCGIPLGEWMTEAERDAELNDFAEKVRQRPEGSRDRNSRRVTER